MDIIESKGSVRQEHQKPIGNYCFFKKDMFLVHITIDSV